MLACCRTTVPLAGLYFITDPADPDPPRSTAALVCEPGSTMRPSEGDGIGEGPPASSHDDAATGAAGSVGTDVDHDDDSNGGGGGSGIGGGKEAAMVAFMSAVHPMEILSRPRAFGGNGAIMRYHRIGNYTTALSGLMSAVPLPV